MQNLPGVYRSVPSLNTPAPGSFIPQTQMRASSMARRWLSQAGPLSLIIADDTLRQAATKTADQGRGVISANQPSEENPASSGRL